MTKHSAIIPPEVRYCKNLSAEEKLLYAEINLLCSENEYFEAGVEYFRDLCPVHSKTISKYLNKLIKENFIFLKNRAKIRYDDQLAFSFAPIDLQEEKANKERNSSNSFFKGIIDKSNCKVIYACVLKEKKVKKEKKQEISINSESSNSPSNSDYAHVSGSNFDENVGMVKLPQDDEKNEKQAIKTENTNKRNQKLEISKLIDEFTQDLDLKKALSEFVAFRKAIKRPMTVYAFVRALDKLKSLTGDPRLQLSIVDQSIEYGWLGFYPFIGLGDKSQKPEFIID